MTVSLVKVKRNVNQPKEAVAEVKTALKLGRMEEFTQILRDGTPKGVVEANYGDSNYKHVPLLMFIINHPLPMEKRADAFRRAIEAGASPDEDVRTHIKRSYEYYYKMAQGNRLPRSYIEEKALPQVDFFKRLSSIANLGIDG